MKTKPRTILATAVCLAVTVAWLAVVGAQNGETSASDLTLRKSYVKAATGPDATIVIDGPLPADPLFSPTTIQCPGGGTCTVRASLSGRFTLDSGEVAEVRALIDGEPMIGLPGSFRGTGTHSHIWIAIDVPAGIHEVEFTGTVVGILGEPADYLVGVLGRVVTIDVFKP